MKELKVTMTLYMQMKDGETDDEAITRFNEEFTTENVTTETEVNVWEFEVQEI